MASVPSTRQLAAIRSGGGANYQLTRSDVLWMARMAAHEGGNPADSLWSITQRFIWFEEARSTYYPSLGDLAQAFSQPINPRWLAEGEFCRPGGTYHGTDRCSPARLANRASARAATLEQLAEEEPDAVAFTVAWSQGLLANPVARATNFANPNVSESYLNRHPEAELVLKRGNWFISEKESINWPNDYIFMEQPSGAIANASGITEPSAGRAFARGIQRAVTDWWRLV